MEENKFIEENKIINILKSIGLSKNESVIYLDLIRVGKSSVIDISKRTGIHRSNTYDILSELLKNGIVDKSTENDKRFFYPVNPNVLLDYHKQKEKELAEIIPKIEEMQNRIVEERKVTLSEGMNSVKNIISSMLDSEEPIYAYGTPKESLDILGGFLDDFHKQRIKKKIPLQRIHGAHSLNRIRELNKMKYTEARYLPSYKSKISTHICDNKVVIIIWDRIMSAITIENKEIAEAYKNNFQMLWNEARSDFSNLE